MSEIAQAIRERLRYVLGQGNYALHGPRFLGNEQHYVQDTIQSTFVSSVGGYVDRFEKELAVYTGARRAVVVTNGTVALQIALKLAGVQQDDEVIVPSLSFVATANAVHYLGAIPHFADCSEQSFGLDPVALRDWLKITAEPGGDGFRNRHTGRRLKAIVPMHCFGHPCDMEGLLALAHDYKMAMVEDAAESLGSYYHGQHTGTFGVMGTLSFNGNKIITTGGGGAILTNDDKLADHAKHLTTTAKMPHPWEYVHDEIGYNYRMPNINAALGCAQLEQLPDFVASKRKLFLKYQDAFKGLEGVELLQEPMGCQSNYWLQALMLSKALSYERDAILDATNKAGIMTRPVWRLLSHLAPYQGCPHAPLPIAESMSNRIINIPSSVGLA